MTLRVLLDLLKNLGLILSSSLTGISSSRMRNLPADCKKPVQIDVLPFKMLNQEEPAALMHQESFGGTVVPV